MWASFRYQQTVALMLCLTALFGCQQQPDTKNAEIAKAKADADAELANAKAELAQLQSEVQKRSRKCVVSGELFATTQGGDVKKAAGLGVSFTPVTVEFRMKLAEIHKRWHDHTNERDTALQAWELKNPQPDARDFNLRSQELFAKTDEWSKSREVALEKFMPRQYAISKEAKDFLLMLTQHTTTTNSDGKFRIEVEPGNYIMLSAPVSIGLDKLVWCKALKAENAELALSLNQESAVLGLRIGDKAFEPNHTDIMDLILKQIER